MATLASYSGTGLRAPTDRGHEDYSNNSLVVPSEAAAADEKRDPKAPLASSLR